MKTKDKKRLARKHFTLADKLAWKTIYTSKFWLQRKESIANSKRVKHLT